MDIEAPVGICRIGEGSSAACTSCFATVPTMRQCCTCHGIFHGCHRQIQICARSNAAALSLTMRHIVGICWDILL